MERIEDKKTDLPQRFVGLYQFHEQAALGFIEKKDYKAAEQEYKTLLGKIQALENNKVRYHKGGPYHQIGYCLFLQGRSADAALYFLHAFIEDSITLDSFPDLPAFKTLHGVYQISYEDLRTLFTKIKDDIRNNIPLYPEDYLKTYFASGKKIVSVRRETKVFVGGNYRNIAILRYIEEIVRKSELSPILASNFRVDESEIYLHAMWLLEDCGSAIFEITFDAGHLMEIERATKFINNRNILLLYQQLEKEEKHYTRMLWGVEVEQMGYMHIDELAKNIGEFLDRMKQR
jgi:hypothetical protein